MLQELICPGPTLPLSPQQSPAPLCQFPCGAGAGLFPVGKFLQSSHSYSALGSVFV